MNVAVAQHLVQAHQRFRCLCKEHRTAYGAVDAVDNTQKDIARLAVAHADKILYLVFESRITLGVGLYEVAAMLIDGDKVIVLVDYILFAEHITDGT